MDSLGTLVVLVGIITSSFFLVSGDSQALEFVLEPIDVFIREGNSVLLQCSGRLGQQATKGKVTPTIRWRGPDGQDIGIVGDTFRTQLANGSLYISSIEENRGLTGAYQCLLSAEGIGTIVSRPAKVGIATVPELSQESGEVYLFPGQTAYFRCIANPKILTLDPKIYHIQWLKDDSPLRLDETRMLVLPSGALEVDELTASDRGVYQCNVTSGSVFSLSGKSNLNIKSTAGVPESFAAPSFITMPSPQTIKEGDTITLDCIANGNPKPQIRWLKNGIDIDLHDLDSRFRIVGTGSLQISLAKEIDTGVYQCRAINSVDSLDASASVQVQVPPKFRQRPTDKQAQEKDELDLICDIEGKPAPVIQWLKNGDVITPNDYMRVVDGHNLRILGLISSDAGMFQCVGTNPAGSVQAAARLQILQPDGMGDNVPVRLPGPPRDLEAQIIKPRFVTLSWMEPSRHPDEVISYTVFYKMNSSDRERKITTKSQDEQQVNIQSLLPGKTYQFRVVGNSHHGPGESSETLEVSTQPEENIAGPPRNIEGHATSHKEVFVKWEPPLITNGHIQKYRIYYVEGEDGPEMYSDSIELKSYLTELRPFTDYTISVVPFNQNGMGDPSPEIKLKTFSSTPSEPPSNVTLEATSSTSITVRWEPPPMDKRNGQITGYKIRYRKMKKLLVETTPGNAKHYELKNLERNSAYQVKIAAMTVNGSGPFTEWLHAETYEKDLDESQVPRAPGWIRTRPALDTIEVSWSPPLQQDIKIRGYILGWGKGIPDEEMQEFEENVRYHKITGLEANSEYVLSLRARNVIGEGPPIYDYVRTRDETFEVETPAPLEVPVGLRAITMSSNSIVVFWTDTMLSRSQHVTDSRHYLVRYNTAGSSRFKYHNTTDLNCMIGDLKSNTMYEFAVKVAKGRRESAWSMSVFNTTFAVQALSSAPKDLTITPDENNPQNIILKWQMGSQNVDQITGYLVYYTTDTSKRDQDWSIEAIVGTSYNMAVIKNLLPQKTYYFKVLARTSKGNGPFSALISYSTANDIVVDSSMNSHHNATINTIPTTDHGFSLMLYIIIGISVFTLLVATLVVFLLCRRKPPLTPEHDKKSYQKNNTGIIKPPDLWIHHDQMELKTVDSKNQTQTPASDGASICGIAATVNAMTLPRSSMHNFDSDHSISHATNSLDKRAYIPGYSTAAMTTSMERNSQFQRPQYSLPRNHMTMDVNGMSQQSLIQPKPPSLVQTPENPYSFDTLTSSYSNNSTVTYAPGLSIDVPKRNPSLLTGQLKSFTCPTGGVTNGILLPGQTIKPHPIPTVTIRPQTILNNGVSGTGSGMINLSPYKKQNLLSPNSTLNRLQSGTSVAHSAEEVQRLAPSTSTEELNQEMANLEGLMKDLSAITANEFEC